jgi:endogenous inhibitor of DNA gyrase (YacG/DUF329 family)
MSTAARVSRCPQCGLPAALESANTWRPFCSERCKLLDFGAWINGQYTIPAVEQEPDDGEPTAPTLQ